MTEIYPLSGEQVSEDVAVEKTVDNTRLESLVHSILLDHLNRTDKLSVTAGNDLLAIQEKSNTLQSLLDKITAYTDEKTGSFNAENNAELKELLEKAKELGVEFKHDGKYNFNKFNRDNLVENIKSEIKTLTTDLNLQKGKMERLLNEKTEALKSANMIMKTLHDIIMRILSLMKSRS